MFHLLSFGELLNLPISDIDYLFVGNLRGKIHAITLVLFRLESGSQMWLRIKWVDRVPMV